MKLTHQELNFCYYLKKQGVFEFRNGNITISVNDDGSDVKVKKEEYIKQKFDWLEEDVNLTTY